MNLRRVIVMLVGLMVAPVFAGTIHVPADAPTIQIAIEESQPFDTIIVAPGIYFEALTFGGKVIAIQGSNPADRSVVAATIIEADGLGAVVTFSGSEDPVNTILDGLTITGGTVGIDGHRSRAAIRRCIVRDNNSFGIYQTDGIIEDCQIRNNNGTGLVDCDGVIERCLIESNAYHGLYGCDGNVIDSRIERNVYGIDTSSASITRCNIAYNIGSGIIGHTGRITQSLIAGNGGPGVDGGYGDSGQVENCIIAGNYYAGFAGSRKHVLSCTITGNGNNKHGNGYGFVSHQGLIRHAIIWDNQDGPLDSSTTPLFSGTENPYFARPGFWDLVNNVWIDGDYHLSPDSPYIDAGDPTYGTNPSNPTEDIDGNPRIVGARVDIGAYEFQAACEGPDFDGDGTPDICDRDIDGDGVTNVADVCDFTPPGVPVDDQGRPRADLNLDCEVDLRDFAIFQNSMIGP